MTLRPLQGAYQLVLVVAGDAAGVAGGDHAHDEAQHAGGVGAAVDEVSDEDRLAALGVRCVDRSAGLVAYQVVPQGRQERLEL